MERVLEFLTRVREFLLNLLSLFLYGPGFLAQMARRFG